MLQPSSNKDNILGVEHNNIIKNGRLAHDYAGISSVPVRCIQRSNRSTVHDHTKTKFSVGKLDFFVAGPTTWNQLQFTIKSSESYSHFS